MLSWDKSINFWSLLGRVSCSPGGRGRGLFPEIEGDTEKEKGAFSLNKKAGERIIRKIYRFKKKCRLYDVSFKHEYKYTYLHILQKSEN